MPTLGLKMAPRIESLCQLLSRPNAIEIFNQRVLNLRQTLRVVDEGVPRTEAQMIRSFSSWRHTLPEPNKIRKGDSAVIVPLVESSKDGQPWVIFTHRSYLLRRHRGEICFPGGQIDEGETIEQAAIREADEEIGLKAEDITLWGRLPAMFTRHNRNIITPMVGKVKEEALGQLQIRTDEVQSVFMVPLYELVKMEYTAFRVGSTLYRMPVYHSANYQMLKKDENAFVEPVQKIWGLTGGILNELLGALLPDEQYHYVP